MTNFLPVKLNNNDNYINASIIKTNGSGDYYSSFMSNGFVEIKENSEFIKAGSVLKFFGW
jgi:molybdopterin biosynthesis enzyme